MAIIRNKRTKFYILLISFCGLYWIADSLWSFMSFEKNLQVLIFSEPTSLIDTFLLKVSPYQVISRLFAVTLFLISGALLFEFLNKKQRAEAAFKESEEKYRALVSNANEAIFIAQDGVIKFPNPKTIEITGYSEDVLKKMPFSDLIHPEDSQMVVGRYRERINGGSPPVQYSFRVINKQKEIIWVQLNATLIQWEGRSATLNFLSDISEEKKLAEQLQRAEKMEAVGMLAGGVAHDLNNILSGLVSYPDLLLLDLPANSPLREPILTMQDSGKKAAMIVQDLLTLARRGTVGSEIINLNSIIKTYLGSPEFYKLQSFHPGVQVRTRLEPDLLNLIGSPVHLSKTVMNLISNAAEACPGGGMITVSTENQYVEKPVKGYDEIQNGEYAVLKVMDNGQGIAPEDMERIFEPFYTKKVMRRSGTGLGMAVIWGTVKDHHGYIDLESVPDRGTTFSLFFPVTRREVTQKKAAQSIGALKGNGEAILIVDDVEEQRRICSVLLSKLGYVTHAVASGEDAVAYIHTHAADLIVLDMIMDPDMDGLDTYKKIIQICPGQKALIASGFSETERVDKLQQLGAGQYLKKPYTLENLGLAVKAELNR